MIFTAMLRRRWAGFDDRLIQHYGADNVFMDIDTIPPGADFVEYLGSWVGKADVLLAAIGPRRGRSCGRSGREDDFVPD